MCYTTLIHKISQHQLTTLLVKHRPYPQVDFGHNSGLIVDDIFGPKVCLFPPHETNMQMNDAPRGWLGEGIVRCGPQQRWGCGNAICIDPHWVVNQDGTLEDAEGLSCRGLFGSLPNSCFGQNVVSEEECGWIWVVIMWRGGGGNIIDDDGSVLYGIDADCVPHVCFGCVCLDEVQPLEMPPELKICGVSTSHVG